MAQELPLASVDGTIGATTVSVHDEGLLRGDGVFEVCRVYGGRPFALDEHLERMARSAANLRLPFDGPAHAADARALLDTAGALDAALRLVLTRGGRRLAILEPLAAHAPSITLATVEFVPTRILDDVKSLSYAANMLATRIARERGADDALLVTPHGRVLELPTSTFFYVLGGEVCTPPLSDHVLDSITRRKLMDAARERITTLDDLREATEAFAASTLREVQPVRAIDDRPLPETPGPHTARLAALFAERRAAALA
jgi:branched-chain amino acid aminotransferase